MCVTASSKLNKFVSWESERPPLGSVARASSLLL